MLSEWSHQFHPDVGTTNANGEECEDYDPTVDVKASVLCMVGHTMIMGIVQWLHDELHNWIYNNIESDWKAISRRPEKLARMFSGYHATKPFIEEVFRSAGIDKHGIDARYCVISCHFCLSALETIKDWPMSRLHRLVQEFLTVS